jgi:meiotically up-regulated gene 157 (Mug157) protein
MRPDPSCRKYTLPEVEKAIDDMKGLVKDPDLFRLFENAFPNTLDTTVSWKGFASDDTEEEVRGGLE